MSTTADACRHEPSGSSYPVTGACRHDRSHITDSLFHRDAYSTVASRKIFCDECRLVRWLHIEAVLAESSAQMGLVPPGAAEDIVAAAAGPFDTDAVAQGIRRTSHSLVPLLTELQRGAGPSGEFVHYGATTQDIQDTGQVLEIKEVLAEIDLGMRGILRTLAELAAANRDTVMIGRTHAQPALPITFGLKVAGWIDELLRDAERLEQMEPRVLVAELAGGAGTMAGFDRWGPELLEQFARRLSIGVPAASWHVARDRVAEYLSVLAILTGTLARIADEVRTLSRPEFGEVEEAWPYGKVGSSTMPHKRNPDECSQIVVLARLVKAHAMPGLEDMIQEHERDARGLRMEWASVAEASHYTLAALFFSQKVLGGLMVHADAMADRARAADGICSEALMLALGRKMGKQSAHSFVYEVSQAARQQGRTLRDAVAERSEGLLTLDELDVVFDPAAYLGATGRIVDGVVRQANNWLAGGRRSTTDQEKGIERQ